MGTAHEAELAESIERVRAIVAAAGAVAVLTGAGISTAAGIPDFRGPDGLWTRNPEAEKMATISYYMADADIRRNAWRRRVQLFGASPQPTAGHRALVDFEQRGSLIGLATQNVDGLHHLAGSDPSLVHEVHGTLRVAHCTRCRTEWPIDELLDRVRAGDDDPSCTECGGIVKPSVVFFGEMLPRGALDAAMSAASQCDVLLAVGTTLGVSPINGMVIRAKQAGATVVIVNGGPTDMDRHADHFVLGDLQHTLPALLGA